MAKLDTTAFTETKIIIDSIVAKKTTFAKKAKGPVNVRVVPHVECKLNFVDEKCTRLRSSVKIIVDCKSDEDEDIIKFEYCVHTDYLFTEPIDKKEIKSKEVCLRFALSLYQRVAWKAGDILSGMGLGDFSFPLARLPEKFIEVK